MYGRLYQIFVIHPQYCQFIPNVGSAKPETVKSPVCGSFVNRLFITSCTSSLADLKPLDIQLAQTYPVYLDTVVPRRS